MLDPRPQFAQGAELGDGQELIGVGGKAERDHGACGIERNANGFKRPQIGHRDRKRESQFLRLRTARVVHDAAVGGGERAVEAGVGKFLDGDSEAWRQFRPS